MAEAKPNIQDYNQSFLRELERLNPQQREAVDQIEGPVLVIAGPGTGKTHILSARIGRILLETDAQAQNILCLTFTDAGVHAMRSRLLELIGPEAHRVHIYTFHSFCNRIIQDNLEYFGRHDLESLGDLERIEIIRRLIDRLDPHHPLRRGRTDTYFYENHLYDLFKRMKSENWTPEYVHRMITQYLTDLPQRPEFIYQRRQGPFKKGDLKIARYEEAVERMERLRAAVDLFPEFQTAMQQARRYDYDDMILWVLRAFQEKEALLRHYQEQYLYLLVDEYQDTNGAQNEVIKNLVSYWENPNIFIVGDDDQSVYEFQGARLKNLTDFYHAYQHDLKLVLLKENYRSTQPILDAGRTIIAHNEKRIVNSLGELGMEKILQASHPEMAKLQTPPQILVYPNRFQEETDIVLRVEALRKKDVPLNEVAIIYAKHRQARNIVALLEKKGIPYQTKRRVNILDLPVIRNLRLLLEYLQSEYQRPFSGEHQLFRILYFDFLGIAPADLARLSVHQAGKADRKNQAWRLLLGNQALLASLDLSDQTPLQNFSIFIEDMLRGLSGSSLPALIEKLINRSGLLRYILAHEEKAWYLQVIKSFFDFIREENDRQPRLTLRRLLDTLRRMDDNRIPIEVNKLIYAADGVKLLTAHSAKGLEFRYVFLIDCTKDNWEPRGRGGAFRFPFPDTLTLSGEEDAMEARRRLFYVAMTRAQEQLFLTYSERDQQEKILSRAIFIDELEIPATPVSLPPEDLLEAQMLQLLEAEKPNVTLVDRDTIAALLEGFVLSVSAMNRYLKCPLGFYYQNVLRVPVLQSEAASYGTSMHNALQRLFERMLAHKAKAFPPEEELISLFDYEMEKHRGYFSRQEYERRLETGRLNLRAYYRQHIASWHQDVQVELTIKNAEVEGIPITGMIDKLELHASQQVKIIDYKTGSQNSAKLRPPGKANPLGGAFWRQLVFYKILYEASGNHGRTVASGSISYLEPNSRGDFDDKTIQYSAKDVAFVKELLTTTYTRIMAYEFEEGCGQPDCAWCNFVRHHQPVDSFREEEVEELDD